jgi:hypothetical protein
MSLADEAFRFSRLGRLLLERASHARPTLGTWQPKAWGPGRAGLRRSRSPKEHGLIVSPRPGGEPLRSLAALWPGKQAAPGNHPTQCFAHRTYSVWRIQTAHRTATPRDVPGSRLLTNP